MILGVYCNYSNTQGHVTSLRRILESDVPVTAPNLRQNLSHGLPLSRPAMKGFRARVGLFFRLSLVFPYVSVLPFHAEYCRRVSTLTSRILCAFFSVLLTPINSNVESRTSCLPTPVTNIPPKTSRKRCFIYEGSGQCMQP